MKKLGTITLTIMSGGCILIVIGLLVMKLFPESSNLGIVILLTGDSMGNIAWVLTGIFVFLSWRNGIDVFSPN